MGDKCCPKWPRILWPITMSFNLNKQKYIQACWYLFKIIENKQTIKQTLYGHPRVRGDGLGKISWVNIYLNSCVLFLVRYRCGFLYHRLAVWPDELEMSGVSLINSKYKLTRPRADQWSNESYCAFWSFVLKTLTLGTFCTNSPTQGS